MNLFGTIFISAVSVGVIGLIVVSTRSYLTLKKQRRREFQHDMDRLYRHYRKK